MYPEGCPQIWKSVVKGWVVNVAQNATKVHAGMSIEYLSNIAQINLI